MLEQVTNFVKNNSLWIISGIIIIAAIIAFIVMKNRVSVQNIEKNNTNTVTTLPADMQGLQTMNMVTEVANDEELRAYQQEIDTHAQQVQE